MAVDRSDPRFLERKSSDRARLYSRHMGTIRFHCADRARWPHMAREHMTTTKLQTPDWHEFENGTELAETLADTVAQKLRTAIETRGQTLLAVSGGTTPKQFFAALSR